MDHDRLARWFRRFAEIECPTLPMYRRLCLEVADRPDLLDIVLGAAPGQWRPNILLAALHDLVLRHPDESLGRWYPTVGGDAGAEGDLLGAVRSMIDDHAAEFVRLITTRSTQTNEVNRSALWPVALSEAVADVPTLPMAVLEIGPSAGLNLRFDAWDIRYVDAHGAEVARFGDATSPVAVRCEVDRPPTLRPFAVAARLGLDAAPVDLADPDERRWLKACVWPEQLERHARFDAAADEMVRRQAVDPIELRRDDALDGLFDAVDDLEATAGGEVHLVVTNSWVMTYLPRDRREAFDRALDLLGADRTLTRISAEGEGVETWVPAGDEPTDHTVVGLTRWRDGERRDERAAVCHPHLAWLRWQT